MEHIDKVPGTFDRRVQEGKSVVPAAVIKRLPRYYRCLGDLIREGRMRISSKELSEIMEVTASQIRQDLNCFGGFGQQGYGYNIKYLFQKISELLGVAEGYNAVIVGAGNLGRALAATHMFERRGVTRIALFDSDPEVIGTEVCGLPVLPVEDLTEFSKSHNVKIGVLTVPKEAAYDVACKMAEGGILGIWNYANMELKIPYPDVIVENVHLGDSLMTLSYEIRCKTREAENG